MAWVPKKDIDFDNIQNLLKDSFNKNHFTNYGPMVRKLEELFYVNLELDSNKAVIVTNNGAHALHALVEGIKLFKNKELVFTTQDFTFPSALQGPLKKSHVVDIDNTYQFDLTQVRNDSDGIIITNLFGNCCDIKKYVDFCEINNKILLFDNATCPYTFYDFERSNSVDIKNTICDEFIDTVKNDNVDENIKEKNTICDEFIDKVKNNSLDENIKDECIKEKEGKRN